MRKKKCQCSFIPAIKWIFFYFSAGAAYFIIIRSERSIRVFPIVFKVFITAIFMHEKIKQQQRND